VEIKAVDLASIAHLSGIFAPIQEEIDIGPLEVVQGAIPRELTGVYLRNGPNCRFPPLGSYTYPLDGDGMLHAIELADRTSAIATATCARRRSPRRSSSRAALWGGVLTPVFSMAWLQDDEIICSCPISTESTGEDTTP
jgi:carotenoid cleavage dioxygenase-like enzyme